ncbi:amidase [Fluoribacter dumoffii]|uniref:6-aminohexanoate-cyclic-dimer hydrolase n=1 Tax=Fluoribacter dumoffii TaxID=463 RepID=A0A377GA34_9GAMM|nr:amidase [Fluoribacter dumoffii]KTC90349.1 amidase [Fluoribacter dumoffii NY 23]MCW8385666.1 amidase [Fluoribacter dumoffii]MCW8496038.1 amidase [Fluoribacter dumoffii]STO21469.1 6-aminohexanoate-cyclic-dimer hydrolase [Fluoribacter dumoffii]
MLLKEYLGCDVIELAKRIKTREIGPTEVLNCALQRISEVNPTINAVVTDCFDFAKQSLKKLNGNEPFYGVPLLVKDLGQPIAGIRSTEGSRFFAHNIAQTTSDLVSKMMALGFIPIAKTNTPELGLSYVTESALLGPCRNPYDPNRTAGGSSGGSAAAVAAGIAPVATASDGGGSIRIPAACCGLFGFKPTTGITPSGPLNNELWSGLAVNFVLTRSLRDSEALFSHIADQSRVKPLPRNKKLNIVSLDGVFAPVSVEFPCLQAVKKAEELLRDSGHRLQNKYVAMDLNAIAECVITIIAANTYTVIKLQEIQLGKKAEPAELEPVTWEFYQQGQTLSAYDFLTAKSRLYQLMQPLHQILKQTDIVLTPALAQLPLYIGELSTDEVFDLYLQKNVEFSPFTSLFNQAGLPAMTLPVMFHNQLPVSVQMGAAQGNDLLLYSIARELQTVLPDFTRLIPLT